MIGLMIPKSFTEAVGMSESTYRWFSAIAGAVAGAVCVVGFVGLVYRRATNVARAAHDVAHRPARLLPARRADRPRLLDDVRAQPDHRRRPYDYRDSVSAWWRSLFILQPDVEAVQDANTVYQVHAIIAWAFWALFPFSRLVHAWSIPLQYLGPPVHPLPAPLRRDGRRDERASAATAASSRSRTLAFTVCFYAWACSARSAPTCRRSSGSPTSQTLGRWSPSRCCSAR